MKDRVNFDGKDVVLSASAATPYLYKTLFKSDLLIDIKNLRDNDRDKYETAGDTTDIFQQLTYIMYLEANFPVEEVYRKLSFQDYVGFLMTIEPNSIIRNAMNILAIYNGNSKSLSEAKNE